MTLDDLGGVVMTAGRPDFLSGGGWLGFSLRVNVALCLLVLRGKNIPGAGAQCLVLTFLAKAAGSKCVFDLPFLSAK